MILRFPAALLTLCIALSGVSCGIDEFIYLYPVDQRINNPSNATADAQQYFEFNTSDADNSSSAYFKGFEIYYRIYNQVSVRDSDISAINTYNTNYPTTIQSYLTTTKKYQRLEATTRIGSFPLIPKSAGSDQYVKIRLVDYGVSDLAEMTVDGSSYGVPLRTKNEGTSTASFLFDEEDLSETSDTDITWSTPWFDDVNKKWYVQAYVLAYGTDSSYKAIYSEAYSLGFITISE